ncbi:MAG: sigma-70 family RNA polymerase sigma factor [Thermoanaerobaculia bacterium]|nr:sigma-70 family RNA polymerase sigma factor [Thermoanaerobaculia bacterium]
MQDALTMEGGAITGTAETQQERLGRLFDRNHQRLYRLALRMTSDPEEARDLVQEAFLRAAGKPDRVPDDVEGGGRWLVRVVVNLCRDRYRRRGVRRSFRERHAEEAPEPTVIDPDAEGRNVARTAIRQALVSLSPRRRVVIVLHELEGRSTPEIAEILGIAPATVRWHLVMARRDLAEILYPESQEEASS